MNNLFEASDRKQLIARLDKLGPDSKRQWGTMSVDQMLWHCNRFMSYVEGEYAVPFRGSWFMKVFIRPLGLGKMPFPKAKGKTMPEFKALAHSHYDFEAEKNQLKEHIDRFAVIAGKNDLPDHPLFGKFTAENWARIAYKHTDHHLRQFGV